MAFDRGEVTSCWQAGLMVMSDDEQALEGHATTLARLLSEAIPGWVRSAIAQRVLVESPETTAMVDQAAEQARAELEPELRALLALDIDEQTTTPLTVARGATVHVNAVLESLGVPPAQRDEHARQLHPGDVYDLTPGGFVDFGDDVQTAGLTWGAAKAHVHKQRRRSSEPVEERVVAVVPNMMDQGRFRDVTFVASAAAAAEAKPTLLFVDLDRVGDFSDFVSEEFPTIGFGAHVDQERLEQAKEVGFADAMPRSVFFKRLATMLNSDSNSPGGDS